MPKDPQCRACGGYIQFIERGHNGGFERVETDSVSPDDCEASHWLINEDGEVSKAEYADSNETWFLLHYQVCPEYLPKARKPGSEFK